MRRCLTVALPLLLLAAPAGAQHWNDSGPGRDLLSSTTSEFDSFRQRTPGAPAFTPGAPTVAGTPQAQARQPIPILDWVPPPATAQPTTPRRSAPRRTATRQPAPLPRDPAPLPAAVPAPTTGGDWERTLAERERELDRLRRILEEDRLRYQQSRQPTLR